MIKYKVKKISAVKIVGDGLLSAPIIGEGRFIPAMILQTTHRPDIDELLRVHEHTPPGDVLTQWAIVPFRPQCLILQMRFEKPMACEFDILFDVDKNSALIDAIMHAQAVYIQPGVPGDSLSQSMDKNIPRIIAEIPRPDYFEKWNKLILKIMTKKMRAQGMERHVARKAAVDLLKAGREIWNIRRG